MKHRQSKSEDYIPVSIYKDFYFNKNLGLPTVIKEYQFLEKALVEHQYLACITAQVEHLQKIEYQYGSDLYNKMLSRITTLLKDLKTEDFREEDIFVVDLIELDTFVIFLSAPREHQTQLLDHQRPVLSRHAHCRPRTGRHRLVSPTARLLAHSGQ